MFLGGEFIHVRAHFHDHRLGKRDPEAIHDTQIHSANSFQVPPYLFMVVRPVLAVCVAFALALWLELTYFPVRAGKPIHSFNLLVACLDLSGVEVEHLQGLLQDEQVFHPPGYKGHLQIPGHL